MRKIDKSCHLSTEYKIWEENLSIPHSPKYRADRKYYLDIVMQLFNCQDGLCAFTEQRLCAKKEYESSLWEKGRYKNGNKERPPFKGELDHVDHNRKKEEAWAWDNFLMIDSDVNKKVKGEKDIDYILIPDQEDYDVNRLLIYNTKTNRFEPHPELTNEETERIDNMLKILGINWGPVIAQRTMYLRHYFKLSEFDSTIEIEQFPTAIAMRHIIEDNTDETSFLDTL